MADHASGQLLLNLEGLPAEGVDLIGPDNPAYEGLFSQVSSDLAARDAELVKPVAAILLNRSSENVLAYTVRWTYRRSDGRERTHTELNGSGIGFIGEGFALPPALKAGAMDLVAPGVSSSGSRSAGSGRISRFVQRIEGSPELTVSLDFVLFADGSAGPDRSNSSGKLRARLEAQRDVYAQILTQEQAGTLNTARLKEHLDKVRTGKVNRDAQADYRHFEEMFAAEAFRIHENAGKEALVTHAQQVVSAPSFVLRPHQK